MSLGRLLATGKSLVSVRDEETRFRASRRVSLPKFLTPKNPFATTTNKEVEPVRTVTPRTPADDLPQQAADTAARAASWHQVARSAARVAVMMRMWDWFREREGAINPFRRSARKLPTFSSPPPRTVKAPVQCELSLDNVRVVRNDLSDADIVVVQMRSSAKSGAAEPILQTARNEAASERSWSRFATRLFGPGAT